MNLKTITFFAIALTLYLVGASALKLITSILPIPIPIECLLIGLFMGMFPRRTAIIFYIVTCGVIVIETLISIPNLMTVIQTTMNLGLALGSSPVTILPSSTVANYSGALGAIVVILSIIVLVKYRMRVVKIFFEVMLVLVATTIYTTVPLSVFSIIVIGLSGLSVDELVSGFPVLLTYILVLWSIYITVTGPLVARWLFNRIGIYRRIPQIG
jgi:hypothetical protein